MTSTESVELHVSYNHPPPAYIPKSISSRWAPIQVTTPKIEGTYVAQGFVVPPDPCCYSAVRRARTSVLIAQRCRSLGAV